MERCLDEISSTVLDAGEPISYRTLSIRCQVPVTVSVKALAQFSTENRSVKELQVLVKRVTVDNTDKSETAAAKRDPRARVLSLAVGSQIKSDNVLCQQIYGLYNKPRAEAEDANEAEAVAIACWAQERQTRNQVFATVDKHAPLSAAVKALYGSGIKCVEATARQDFGEEQGEETVSAFDAITASATKKSLSSNSSSTFFKSSNHAACSKVKSSSRNRDMNVTNSTKQETKNLDMSNVLTVDSDDEEDDETDAPLFVQTTSNKRIISDDEEEEDEVPCVKETETPPTRKSRNVKRKLNASPAEPKEANLVDNLHGESHSDKKQRVESKDEADDDSVEKPVLDTKRRVLVTKTRINEQGYMVTENSYEEVELTSEEIEREQEAAKTKVEEEKKKKAAAEKAAKAKKEKQSGPPKQRDLRSFFSTK